MVDKNEHAAEATRSKTFLLAGLEQRALQWLAPRLPARVMPDHLTALGVLAALGIAGAYVLSNDHPAWLLVATGLLVVHWLGDSLDGTLARVRRIERPTYGYYLDHLVDGFATAAIGIGLGLSPHMLLATGLVDRRSPTCCSRSTRTSRRARSASSSLGYGRFGPTEARVGLAGLNVALFAGRWRSRASVARRRRDGPRPRRARRSPAAWSRCSSSAPRRTSACSPSASPRAW